MRSEQQQMLSRFLAGRADDTEVATAEALLTDDEIVSSVAVDEDHDNLLQAFRQKPREELEQADVRALADRIGQWLAPDDGDSDDWRRFLEPPREAESIGQIGRFSVRQLLARGGTGLVFEAIDGDSGQAVCLKLLQPHRAQHLAVRQRFMGEAKTATRLQHPRIVPIHEVAQHGQLPYLVMPLLTGQSLRSWLQSHERLDPLTAVRAVRQAAEGLEHAHGLGILHRDIKPDNLWLLPNGEVQILDFGLARTTDDQQPITLAGTVLGTPSYMSPEQVTAKPLDGRSDLFSLGVVLWEMLTGHSPFRRDNLFSTLMSVATDEVDTAGDLAGENLPAPLRELLGRLLAKSPEQRPGSARELIHALDKVELALMAPQPSPELPMSRASHGRGGGVRLAAAAVAGAFFCCFGFWLWQSQDKGTLVVETHDGQVEVRIQDQRVTVTDPVTEKVYEVGIGATPLPSGVYLLEASVDGTDLDFSSQTIVIRRGQETLVTVRLRPATESGVRPTEIAGDNATKPGAESAESDAVAQRPPGANPLAEDSGSELSSEPIPHDFIVDRSYAPAVEDTMAVRLDGLPAQANLDEHDTLGGISTSALVAKPVKLPNYDAWSLEVPADDTLTWTANSDHSLWVGVGRGVRDMVWVADPSGQVRYVIPTLGMPVNASPSPTQPRLLATISWRGSSLFAARTPEAETPESRVPQYCLQLWRLNADSATLLSTAAIDRYQVLWDGSYRLLFQRDGGVWAYRVDSGQSYRLVDAEAGDLVENSLSPNKRWLAFQETTELGSQIQVYDLHRGQPLGEFNNIGYKLQWHDDRIIVDGGETQPIELWQVDPLKLLQRIDPPRATESGSERRREIVQAIDAAGQRVARLSDRGELTITRLFDLETATILAAQLRDKRQRLVWQPDGTLLIQNASGWYQWRGGLDNVHGRVTEYSGAVPPTDITPFRLQRASESAAASTDAPNHYSWQPTPTSRSSVDGRSVSQFRILNNLDSAQLWQMNWNQWLKSSSPDGAFQLRDNRLWSMETDEEVYQFGAFRTEGARRGSRPVRGRTPQLVTAWSADSRWLVVSGSRYVDPTVVLNLTTLMPLDLARCFPDNIGNRQVRLLQAVGSSFWLTFEDGPEVWQLDPERTVAAPLPIPQGLKGWTPSHLAPPYVFFRRGPAGWSSNPNFTRQVIRAKWEDARWTDLQELTIGINDELLISPSGLAYLQIVDPPGTGIQQQPGGGWIKVVSAAEPSRLTLAQWPAGEPGGTPQRQVLAWEWRISDEPQWHDSGRSLIFTERHGVGVIDLESGKYHEYGGWTSEQQAPAVATEYGWLVGRPDQFMALGHDGRKLAVLPLSHSLRSESSGNSAEHGSYEESGRVGEPDRWRVIDGRAVRSGRSVEPGQDEEPVEKDEPGHTLPRGTWILADGRVHPQAEGSRYFVGRRGAEFVTIPMPSQADDTRLPDLPTYTSDAVAWLLELPD